MAKKKKQTSREDFDAKAMLDQFVADANEVTGPYYSMKFHDIASSNDILALSPRQMAQVALLALDRNWKSQFEHYALFLLGERLYRRKLPYTSDEIESVCQRIHKEAGNYIPVSGTLITMVERYSAANELSEKSQNLLRQAVAACQSNNAEQRKIQQRLRKLTGVGDEPDLKPGEAWSEAALEEISKLRSKKKQAAWKALLVHCQNSDGGQPKKQWADSAKKLIKQVGSDDFFERIVRWFTLVDRPRTQTLDRGAMGA